MAAYSRLASQSQAKFHTKKFTGDPLHSRAACTQPCNVNTHSRAHCSPGARLCEQWEHGCVNNGARLCASARLCRGSPVKLSPLVHPCAAAPAQSTTSAHCSLDFCRATSSPRGRWVGSWPLLLRSVHEDTS